VKNEQALIQELFLKNFKLVQNISDHLTNLQKQVYNYLWATRIGQPVQIGLRAMTYLQSAVHTLEHIFSSIALFLRE